MILPNELNVSLWFSYLPVWEWEAKPAPDVHADPEAGEAPPECAAPDGDGTTSMCWVFKGFEWQTVARWESLANPSWLEFVDGRRDESDERSRRNDRNLSAALRRPPLPVASPVPDGPHAVAGDPAPSGAGAGDDH